MRIWRRSSSVDQRLQGVDPRLQLLGRGRRPPKIAVTQVNLVALAMVEIGDRHVTTSKHERICTPVTGEDVAAVVMGALCR